MPKIPRIDPSIEARVDRVMKRIMEPEEWKPSDISEPLKQWIDATQALVYYAVVLDAFVTELEELLRIVPEGELPRLPEIINAIRELKHRMDGLEK